MDKTKVIEIIQKIAIKIEENKQFLADLDNPIGDGDHGINMARGFNKVETKIPTYQDKDIASILKDVGMTLVSTVGGSAGPLYGSAFMYAGNVAINKQEIDLNDFIKMLEIAIEAIKKLGKANQGEKTMLDAMIPALEAIKTTSSIKEGVIAAYKGVEYTKNIIATKGRASYVGERSIGHQDPGATSFAIILETISENI